MQISKITGLTPKGYFESQYGTMYTFALSFEDGVIGEASAKSNPPAYRVGDTVGYDITGSFKGMNKLKVTKNPDRPFSPPPQTAPASTPAPVPPRAYQAPVGDRSAAPASQDRLPSAPVHGATVGLAVKEGIVLTLQTYQKSDVGSADFWADVHRHASAIIAVCAKLDRGEVPDIF